MHRFRESFSLTNKAGARLAKTTQMGNEASIQCLSTVVTPRRHSVSVPTILFSHD